MQVANKLMQVLYYSKALISWPGFDIMFFGYDLTP